MIVANTLGRASSAIVSLTRLRPFATIRHAARQNSLAVVKLIMNSQKARNQSSVRY